MGLCASKPAVLDAAQQRDDGFKPHIAAYPDGLRDIQTSKQQQVVEEQIPETVVADDAQQVDDIRKDTTTQPCGASSSAMMILEVKKLLQDLANIQSGSLCVSCTQAATAVRRHLKGVDHVGIVAFTSSPAVCITPGLDGEAYDLLCHRRVVTDAAWAIALTAPNSGSTDSISTSSTDSSNGRMYHTILPLAARPGEQQQHREGEQQQQDFTFDAMQDYKQQQEQKHHGMEPIHPSHWELMHRDAGMNTFLAVRIRDATGSVLGLLELASKQHNAFIDDWWDPVLSIVCSSLVPLLSCPIASCMKSLMGHLVDVRHDFNTFASTCIQGVAALLEMVTNLHLDVRLGLLSPDSQQVLLLHVNMPHQPPSICDEDGEPTGEVSSSYFGSAATAIANGRLLAECLDAQQTLLVEAVAAKEPRVLEDTTAPCLEESGVKATDIFVGPDNHNTPNSVMVVPLLNPSGGTAFGALYATQSKRGDFCESRVAVECVATGLQALFAQQLITPPSDWSSYLQPPLDVTPSNSSNLQRRRLSSGSRHDSSTISRRNSSNLSHSSFLGTMVKAIQIDVQQYLDSKKQYETDIQLLRVLGRGGFGTVFEGRWQGCRAAVKVMYVPESLRRLMKCALEMATMATISHPNIVRVYSCLTDMVEETGAVIPGQVSSPRMIRFRPALPKDYDVGDNEEQSAAICNIMVMELCDLGNLRRALEKGLLHKPLMESRRIVVDMELLLEVLLDIARSIQHIHSLNMLHCDIKADNVLLKSSSSSSKQFICKLADFGLMKVMQSDKMYLRNMSISGTITHVAPERLEGDSQLTVAVDSYGFGMLMWEVYTCQAPFASLRPAEIVRKVYKGERPAFPANTPAPYQQLAEACWSHNPSLRPSMDVIVQQLQIWRAHLAANPPASS